MTVSNESPSCLSLLPWSPGNCLYSPSLGCLQDVCFCPFGVLAPTLEVVQCEFSAGGGVSSWRRSSFLRLSDESGGVLPGPPSSLSPVWLDLGSSAMQFGTNVIFLHMR